MENWMITSYEVEFGPLIGSGGLYVFYLSSSGVLPDFSLNKVDKYSRELGMGPPWLSRF
jgi:hypothetical protein